MRMNNSGSDTENESAANPSLLQFISDEVVTAPVILEKSATDQTQLF